MLDDADLLEGGRVDDMNGLLCGAGRLLITCAGVPGQFAVLTLCRRRDQPTVDGGEDAEEVRPEAHGGGKERGARRTGRMQPVSTYRRARDPVAS